MNKQTHKPLAIAVSPLREVLSLAPSSGAFMIAFGVATALVPSFANAQNSQESSQLPKVTVDDSALTEYKTDRLSQPKYTEPLRDVPQNVSVISSELIQSQGALSLRDILSNVPGITFGGAEGGNGYGDNIILRGYDASNNSSDITIDGVRDSARTIRSDSFNLEQVEVVKGPNSVYSGSGSVSGSINMVSKTPKQDTFTIVSAGLGTDNYRRATIDTNQVISDTAAFRLNLMKHENDVAGRDFVDAKRWGVAPSIAFGLGTPTKVTLSAQYQEDEGLNDYGIPVRLGKEIPGVKRSNYYGWHNIDSQESTSSSLTATVDHQFNENVSLRNLSRWSKVDGNFVNSAIQGNICLHEGEPALGGTAICAPGSTGKYFPAGPRGAGRESDNTIAMNQTDLTSHFVTGGVDHTLVTGVQLSTESGDRHNYNYLVGTQPAMDLYNPNSFWAGDIAKTLSGKSESKVDVAAIYAFDTLKFSEHWQASLGLRYEQYRTENTTYGVTNGAVTSMNPTQKSDDNILSGRIGLVYKPQENGSIYVAYGTSANPSSTSVNAACGSTNCNIDPEKSVNYELGTKWDFVDGRLGVTAALFRNAKTNARVNSGDPDVPQQVLDGESQVQGVELGLSGKFTDQWSIYAGYAYLDSEILQSISNYAAENGVADAQKGHALPNTPKHSANLWTTYTFTNGLTASYGLRFAADAYIGSAPTADGLDPKIPSYVVHNAMLGYNLGDLTLQLNVNNLTNEEYFTTVSTNLNRWAAPAPERSAVLSGSYRF